VSRGYSPIAPERPDFEIIPTHNTPRLAASDIVAPAVKYPAMPAQESRAAVANVSPPSPMSEGMPPAKGRKRRTLRRLLTFAVILIAFTGVLYGTASYIRGRNLFADIKNPFKPQQSATANTDIYLRPSPNTDSDPIGLVTKNSKVKIVTMQNNWYQVDVIEQGRVRPQAANATRGWLNGKYLDLNEN
jgi:hypothetical protein